MAPRTRATAALAPVIAPLAVAPRRRVKVTSLEKEKPSDEVTIPATRAGRTKKPTEEKATTKTKATATATATAPKPRGRPRKTESTEADQEEGPAERLTEKPKRATRSNRATATTASSSAKEKPVARATRTTRAVVKDVPLQESELGSRPVAEPRTALKKRVTFQEILEAEKENQPVTTRGGKKSTASKPSASSTGLGAKPVRNKAVATATATRTRKRSQPDDPVEEQEEEARSKKIQRVLTPKKITQVARAVVQEDEQDSDDELNRGKTPVKDLSMSPRRPHTSVTADAVAKVLSPAKRLDAVHPRLLQSPQRLADAGTNALASPARRAPVSVARLFPQSTMFSAVKPSHDAQHGMNSPARRPLDSPAKLLFPHATRTEQRVQLSQSSNLLFQSPKRTSQFDPARMFAQSAIKTQKTTLSKSSFFSSPAKRTHLLSPNRNLIASKITEHDLSNEEMSTEVDLNDMEITELIKDGAIEISISSHQRPSASPVRPYRLNEMDLQMDFDESILNVRSPLKFTKSPAKQVLELKSITEEPRISDFIEDGDMTVSVSGDQNTPSRAVEAENSFIDISIVQTNAAVMTEVFHEDTEMTMEAEDGDDTIVLLHEVEQTISPAVETSAEDMDLSIDELAASPEEDVMSRYLQSPTTPTRSRECDIPTVLSSPDASGTPAVANPLLETFDHDSQRTPEASTFVPDLSQTESSPAYFLENELTLMAGQPSSSKQATSLEHVSNQSPASIYENELTMMGGTPRVHHHLSLAQSPLESSPVGLHENELTVVGNSFTPRSVSTEFCDNSVGDMQHAGIHATPPSVYEKCVTVTKSQDLGAMASPASVAEHELTTIGERSPECGLAAGTNQTPLARTEPISSTPDVPILRPFHMHTIVSKVPLKPEGEDSPVKFQLKKRKRPVSLGGQINDATSADRITPKKFPRTTDTVDASSRRSSATATPTLNPSTTTPRSNSSTVRTARRVVSTPLSRTVLTPSVATGVLNGAIVYVDVKTSEGADASAMYIDLLTALGAKASKEWKANLTHAVFKDGNLKVLDKARLADVKVVGVSWPLDCDVQKEWLDETDYLFTLNPVDRVLKSVSKSARRKSMEPSLLVADGSGSIKRARINARHSTGRRNTIKPMNFEKNAESPAAESVLTPKADPVKQQAAIEKNSLTAAWKSINAPTNLGEDTPARRTLELLQKSYEVEADWDDTILSEENDENTPQPFTRHQAEDAHDHGDDEDVSIIDTGLTPAPFRTKQQIGSAPSKLNNVGLMTYRERVEEMERREMRNNAFGTNKGERGLAKGGKDQAKSKGKRMTMFGFEHVGK